MKYYGLEWHRNCVNNMKYSLLHEERKLEQARTRVENIQASIALRERQIAEAERRGMDTFDPDRLLIKRPRRVADAAS